MKVYCIGYFDKFSRFFIGIKKQLQLHKPQLQFSIGSMYLSGYLYSFVRGISSTALSFRAWRKSFFYRKKYDRLIAMHQPYKGIDTCGLVRLYGTPKQKKNYVRLVLAYIDILEKKLANVDVLLLIGDLRLPFEIAQKLVAKKHTQVYFIEQGPYKTTVFDQKGVNANASIRGYINEEEKDISFKKSFIKDFLHRKKNKKYNRSPLYRGLDFALEFLLNKTCLLPPDLKIDYPLVHLSPKRLAQKAFVPQQLQSGRPVFLLIGQVPFDVNMTHHSPFYSNHFQILKDVHTNLPENSLLIVREHPVYKNKYGKDFYNYIIEHENIFIDLNKGVDQAFKVADAVVVNNSTVGVEAIANGKRVVALANSYYDSSEICLKMNSKQELPRLLQEALTYQIDDIKRTNFLYEFFSNHLIDGFITDKDLAASKTIAKKIIDNFTL